MKDRYKSYLDTLSKFIDDHFSEGLDTENGRIADAINHLIVTHPIVNPGDSIQVKDAWGDWQAATVLSTYYSNKGLTKRRSHMIALIESISAKRTLYFNDIDTTWRHLPKPAGEHPIKSKHRVSDIVDSWFSHNEIVSIWFECAEFDGRRFNKFNKEMWHGMAHEIPDIYLSREVVRLFGCIPESITQADTINILIK